MRLECAKIGLAAIDVPGDGNCLIWALRSLILGLREMAPPDSDMGKKDALNIRQTLKECWIDASSKIVWQDLFLVFIEQDNAPQTPEKRTAKAGNLVDIVDLLTPPEKEKHPKKKPKKPSPKKLAVDRVGGGRPAQAEEFTPSPTLKKPPPKKTSPSIAPPTEQPPPDEGKKRKVNSIDITDWVDEMLEEELISDVESPDEAEEGEPTRKRRKHNRVKKKVKTEREIEEDLVREFLAVRNVTYANWLLVHRRMCSIPKASVCDEGGFLRFTTAIRINKDIKCKSCLEMCRANGISHQGLQTFMEGRNDEDVVDDDQAEIDQGNDAKPGDDQGEMEEPENRENAEVEACKKFVTNHAPIIELVENCHGKGYKFAYRCVVCRTKKQPEGKINTLVRPKLRIVQHFLKQHMCLPSHRKNLKAYNESKDVEKAARKACPGVCMNGPESPMRMFIDEYKLWATLSTLNGKCSEHQYWTDLSTDKWILRMKFSIVFVFSILMFVCCFMA